MLNKLIGRNTNGVYELWRASKDIVYMDVIETSRDSSLSAIQCM